MIRTLCQRLREWLNQYDRPPARAADILASLHRMERGLREPDVLQRRAELLILGAKDV